MTQSTEKRIRMPEYPKKLVQAYDELRQAMDDFANYEPSFNKILDNGTDGGICLTRTLFDDFTLIPYERVRSMLLAGEHFALADDLHRRYVDLVQQADETTTAITNTTTTDIEDDDVIHADACEHVLKKGIESLRRHIRILAWTVRDTHGQKQPAEPSDDAPLSKSMTLAKIADILECDPRTVRNRYEKLLVESSRQSFQVRLRSPLTKRQIEQLSK